MNTSLILSLIIGLLILALLVAFLVVYRHKKKKVEPNYRVFFTIGIIRLPIGIATENPGLWAPGLAFLIIGLVNKSKWKEEKKWSDLPK